MNQIFEKTCHKFINLPALGTSELLSEVDEVQPNGKVFKKAIFGKYNWITFQELLDKVDAFAKGLSQLGIKKVGIYMESRADWMIAVQACFREGSTFYFIIGGLVLRSYTKSKKKRKIQQIFSNLKKKSLE